MITKIFCFAVLLLCVESIASLHVYAQPEYTLSVVDASGKKVKVKGYRVDASTDFVVVFNSKSKKRVWQEGIGGTGFDDLLMNLSPDRKHAALFFNYGVKGQSLYWLSLPDGPPPDSEIDLEQLPKKLAEASGTPEELLNEFWFDVLKWDKSGRCLLKWGCMVHGDSDTTFDAGIAIVAAGDGKPPRLIFGPFATGLTIEESRDPVYTELLRKIDQPIDGGVPIAPKNRKGNP